MSRPALLLVFAMCLSASLGCGDDDGASQPESTATSTTTTSSTATTAPTVPAAEDLFPDLTSHDLVRGPIETIPGPAGYQIAFAVYQGPAGSARAEIRTYPSEAAARTDFSAQVRGWKSPIPGQVFPIDLQNVDGTALVGPDEAHAYVASRADASGNRVWTDIYRIGPVIVVAHALTDEDDAAADIRLTLAGEILALLK